MIVTLHTGKSIAVWFLLPIPELNLPHKPLESGMAVFWALDKHLEHLWFAVFKLMYYVKHILVAVRT